MKIGDVRIKDVRRDMVFVHLGLVGMTFGANLRRVQAKAFGGWIGDIMHAVAINAGRDIGITVVDYRCAVNAGRILFENLAVTLGAGLGDTRTRLVRHRHVVRRMAVGADWGIAITARQLVPVFAIKRVNPLLFVTCLAE